MENERARTVALIAATLVAPKFAQMDHWRVEDIDEVAPNAVAMASRLLAEAEKPPDKKASGGSYKFRNVRGI